MEPSTQPSHRVCWGQLGAMLNGKTEWLGKIRELILLSETADRDVLTQGTGKTLKTILPPARAAALCRRLHLTQARFLQQTKIDLRSLYNQLPSLALLPSVDSLAARWRVIWYIFICKIKFGEERDNFIK